MITSKMTKYGLFLFCGVFLMGCQSLYSSRHSVKPVAAEADVVSIRLAQAAEKAAAALDTIAGIEQHRAPSLPPAQNYANAPSALQQLMTVKWAGPVENILETLAARVNMRFSTKGNKAAVPLLVNINVYQKPVIEVLHDLGLQVGRRADITVHSSRNYIEIRYSPVDRT